MSHNTVGYSLSRSHVRSSLGMSIRYVDISTYPYMHVYKHSLYFCILIELIKGKALKKKHSMHWKTAASVVLKLVISGDERCHTTDAPYRMSGTLSLNIISTQSMIPEDQKNITTH